MPSSARKKNTLIVAFVFTSSPPPHLYPLSLHDALPICELVGARFVPGLREELTVAVALELGGVVARHVVADERIEELQHAGTDLGLQRIDRLEIGRAHV